MSATKPTVLLVLDGWGHAAATDWNAITTAPAENFLSWWNEWPHALLSASGREVGLPLGLMGNSEVGHTNIGAGRVVYQTISRIDKSLSDGSFPENGALRGTIAHVKQQSKLHLFGLVGTGGVHAIDRHYDAILAMAAAEGLSSSQIVFHAILDGRDTPPNSAPEFLRELQAMLAKHGGRIATVCGRYWAMDRDTNWERTERYWNCMVHGRADHNAATAVDAVSAAFERGENDEFVAPTIIGDPGAATGSGNPSSIQDGDAVFCFNYRADRVRQMTEAFLFDDFGHFNRGVIPDVHYASMCRYRDDFSCPVAFPPQELHSLFGELVSAKGLRQFRCAETEKYAHVTFFFNGGREAVYPGEDRVLVPSPKVATYDLKPSMSALEVTDAVCQRLKKGEHDLYVVNFANSDMVGHTGIQDAAREAVRVVDACIARISKLALAAGGTVAITADHGNSEMMVDPTTGIAHTAHTLNPVPFLLMGEAYRGMNLREMGVLADVAPTLMQAMRIDQPEVMDGRSLLLP